MSARVFQSVILQIRDSTPRTVGVIGDDGVVVACSDLALIGQTLGKLTPPEPPDSDFISGGMTFRAVAGGGGSYDYAVFVDGTDEMAGTLCCFAMCAMTEAKTRFDENNDRAAFVKSIMSGNVLPGDIATRAKDLHFSVDTTRACLLVRQYGILSHSTIQQLREMFPDKQSEFIVTVNSGDFVIVTELGSEPDAALVQLVARVEARLNEIMGQHFVMGIGTPAHSLYELADKYKEALTAIEVGKVFEPDRVLMFYANLGLGRLVYQLPVTMCEMFLREVFQKNPIEALDEETLYTINKFFENNLNVSETSRRLFVHRNTLVYRLEKIKKLTGLDLREFEHAIVFKVALMVRKYLSTQQKQTGR
ncbi:MAG: helix-turn-helix domain-containing protein [Oscillospiraceae bacterium]|jgi:carbohydrate diacid regulator|nr:helix-turn-helix domain-containing protein [Oscillospiraceae bacterium]